jgi:hypothetical protein
MFQWIYKFVVDAWCILVSIRHKIWDIWWLWSWLMFLWCWHEEVVFKAWIITWELCNFFHWRINGIQVAIIFNLFISTCTFVPHKNIRVREELTKIIFLLFGCGIMLYMLTHFFNVSGIKKPIHPVIIFKNDKWVLLL